MISRLVFTLLCLSIAHALRINNNSVLQNTIQNSLQTGIQLQNQNQESEMGKKCASKIQKLQEIPINFFQLQYNGQIWTDQTFSRKIALRYYNKYYTMTRASDMMKQVRLFGQNPIGVADTRQGAFGNCYFISALSSLSKYPDIIKSVFLNAENPAGIYITQWWIGGKPIQVAVDDYFPTHSRKWIFLRMRQKNQIWGMVLQKAWAKIHKNYYKSQGGYAQQVLHALTGAPSYGRPHQFTSQQNLFKMMEDAQKKDFIMGAYTQLKKCGLAGIHAYTPLSTHRGTIASDGKSYDLVKVRNPWGRNYWNGDFSESSGLWTDELKKKFDVKSSGGIFFMKISDYKRCLHYTSVAKIREGYSNTFMQFKNQQKVTRRFKKEKEQTFSVMMEFPPVPSWCEPYRITYTLYKVNDTDVTKKSKVGSASGRDSHITVENGQVGEYEIEASASMDSQEKSFVIHLYSGQTNIRLYRPQKCEKVDLRLKNGQPWEMPGFMIKGYFTCKFLERKPIQCQGMSGPRYQNEGMNTKDACVVCGGGEMKCTPLD